jgi:hypothetical protein
MVDSSKGRYVILTDDTPEIAHQGNNRDDAERIVSRLKQRKQAWLIDLSDLSVLDRSLLMFREIQIEFNNRINDIEVPGSLETRLTLERISSSL